MVKSESNYLMVHRRYGVDDEDPRPLVISFAYGHIYGSRDVSPEELIRFRQDITDVLEIEGLIASPARPRSVEWGDVYRGTTMIDPNDDDIPF